jgi:hypothetical protein
MIQRLQSLYLILTAILSVLFLCGNFITFADSANNSYMIDLQGLSRFTGEGGNEEIEKLLPLVVLLVLIAFISFVTIFLYKKRKIQMKFALGLIFIGLLLLLGLGYYSVKVIRNYNAEIIPGVRLILPVLMLVCSILAYRGIRKDEKLVKSYDRMR